MRRLIVLALFCAACDDPTELPRNSTEEIALAAIVLGADQFLSPSVRMNDQKTAFIVDMHPMTRTYRFPEVCYSCTQGATIQKPAFTRHFYHEMPLSVHSATLTSGWVRFTLTNNLAFDPLRPAAGAFGSIPLNAKTNAPAFLGSNVILGTERAFAPGQTIVDSVFISGELAFFYLQASAFLNSPAGGSITYDTTATITVTTTPTSMLASSVRERSGASSILVYHELDMRNVGVTAESADSGHLRLEIENPMPQHTGMQGSLRFSFTHASGAIYKTVEIGPTTTILSIPFTKIEVGRLLRRTVPITVTGTLNPGWPEITPESKVVLTPTFVIKQ